MLWSRVAQVVLTANSRSPLTRAEYAERWRCTARNVSHVIEHAYEQYGVVLQTKRCDDGRQPYVLVDSGVIDIKKLQTRWRTMRWRASSQSSRR